MKFFINLLKAGKNFFKIIIVFLMVIIFTVSALLIYLYPRKIKPAIFAKLQEILPQQVALNTNAKLEVGRIYGDIFSYLALDDLKLKDAKTSQVYLTVKRVIVKYNPKNYFIYKEPGAIIDSVEISGLKIFIERNKKGIINLTRIAKPTKVKEKKKPPFFKLKILIPDAYIKYTDYFKEPDKKPFIEELKNANVYFDAGTFPLLYVKFKATPKEKKNIEVAAKIDLDKETISANGTLPQKNLVPLIEHFVKNNQFKILSGVTSAVFQLYSKFDFKDPIIIADAKLSSLKAIIKKSPVNLENCDIDASVSSDVVLLKSAIVKVNGGIIHLSGIIYDFKNPQIGIDAFVSVKSFAPFKRFFPPQLKNLNGQLNLRAAISGYAKNPLVEGELALGKTQVSVLLPTPKTSSATTGTGTTSAPKEPQILNQEIKGTRVTFRYYNKNAEILSFLTSTNIVDLQGAGVVNFSGKKPKFSLALATSKINLANLSDLLQMPIDGNAEGIFAVSLASPLRVVGRVRIGEISSLYGLDVQKAATSFLVDGNKVILKTSDVITSGAKIHLSGLGDIVDKKFKFDYNTSLDLENVMPLQGAGDVKGKIFISGRGSGDIKNPTISANIFGGQGYFLMAGTDVERTMDLLSGDVNLVSSKVYLKDLKVLSDKTYLLANGSVNIKGNKDLSVHIDAQDVNIEKILSKPGAPSKFKGIIDAVLDIGGTAKNVTVSGKIKTDEIFYEMNIAKKKKYEEEFDTENKTSGEEQTSDNTAAETTVETIEGAKKKSEEKIVEQLVSSSEGNFVYEKNYVKLKDFTLHKSNSQFNASGEINLNGENKTIDLSVLAKDFDLKDLPFVKDFYGTMKGKVQLDGKINGSLDSPDIDVSLSGKNILAQNRIIDSLSTKVNLKDKKGQFSENIKIGESLVEVTGNVFPANAEDESAGYKISADAKISKLELPTILDLSKSSITEGVEGVLDGGIHFEADITKNDKDAYELKNPQAKTDFKVTQAKFSGHPVNEISGNLEYQNEAIQINQFLVQSEGGMLQAFGRIHTKGDLDFQAQAKNIQLGILQPLMKSKNNLEGTANIILNFSGTAFAPKAYGFATVDKFKYGDKSLDSIKAKVKYYDDTFELQELLVKLQEQVFTAHGTLPFVWEDKKIPENGNLNFDAELSKFDLKLLPSLVTAVETGEGAANFKLHIGGTYIKPNLDGNFSVDNGNIKFASLKNPLKDFMVGISFNQDKINVDKFTGKMGAGDLNLSGYLTLSEFKPKDLNLKLTAKDLAVAMPPSLEGNINADISLGGTRNKPEVKGTISANDTNYILVAGEEKDTKQVDLNQMFAEMPPPIPDILFDLKISMGDNVWIRNANMQIQTTGDIKFQGTLPEPNLSGTLTAPKGTIAYLSSLFRLKDPKVQESKIEFGKRIYSYFPYLDITATTNIEVPDKSDLDKKKKKNLPLDITLKGYVSTDPDDKLDTTFSWDKAEFNVPDSEIITYLAHRSSIESITQGKDVADVLKSEGAQLLTANLRMHLFDPLEQKVEQMFKLSEFKVDYDTDKNFQLKLTKEIYPKLSVSLFKAFSPAINQSLSLEYVFAPHKNLTYGFSFNQKQVNVLKENIMSAQIKTNFENVTTADVLTSIKNSPRAIKEVVINNIKRFFNGILRFFKRKKK